MVEATLNYIAPMDERPVVYFRRPPEGTPWFNTTGDPRLVKIEDARRCESPDLDREGFTCVEHHTAVADLYDAAQVKADYFPELEALVREATGARRVLAFDHNVRSGHEGRAKRVQAPVRQVHNDYTLASGPQRVRDLCPKEAEALLQRRVAIVNVWKPIVGPVQDTPLAFCAADSIADGDLLSTTVRHADRDGEVQSCTFNPAHRWFYYPDMRAEEALLLKCYDSDEALAQFTVHTAFDDPTAPPNAARRQSIEVRTLVFF